MISKTLISMIKKVSILLILFIFGIIAPGWADEVKSIHNMTNQEIRNKMDENKRTMREKKGPAKTATQLSGKNQNRSLNNIPYIDYGARVRRTTLKINFLKAVEEKKRIPLTECLDSVISSYDFAQHVWKDKLFNFMGTAEAHLSKPESSQSILGSPSTINKYFDEGRVLDKFKPFKPKREESFKTIFMEFRLTYNPVSQRVFLKMNVTPSENEPGFIIPFK
jgi:hypothetical protein